MNERTADQAGPVSFGEKLASSQAFAMLFRDGMALVEETAAYLDGPGRRESKKLERSAALSILIERKAMTRRFLWRQRNRFGEFARRVERQKFFVEHAPAFTAHAAKRNSFCGETLIGIVGA